MSEPWLFALAFYILGYFCVAYFFIDVYGDAGISDYLILLAWPILAVMLVVGVSYKRVRDHW